MSDDDAESLLLLELLVENIQLEGRCKASRELALRVTVLDFPALLIRQPRQSAHAQKGDPKVLEYVFNRGKSCFFKMNLRPLLVRLTGSPLHALVLDVTEEKPRLLGSCLLSLAEAMSRVWQDVTERGSSRPSSHGERRLIGISDPSGEKVGTISLSYKLAYLGAGLLPHIPETRVQEGTGQDHVRQERIPAGPLACEEEHPPTDPPNQAEGDPNTCDENKNAKGGDSSEEDFTLVCPPQLYYCSAAHENPKKEDHILDFDALTLDDSASEKEDEGCESAPPQGLPERVVAVGPQASRSQTASGGTQNALREALQQLPLLNALVAELSQLFGEGSHQASSVYRGQASSAGHRNASQELHRPLHTCRQPSSSSLIHLQPPPSSSKPHTMVKRKDSQEEIFHENRSCKRAHRKNLVYGTTKTFNLRLKQISPNKGKRRECMEAKSQTASRTAKGKLRSYETIPRSSQGKSLSSLSINENPEVRRLTRNSAVQETSTVRQKTQGGGGGMEQGRHTPGISEKAPRSPGDWTCIPILSTETDRLPCSKDEHQHHSKSDQSESDRDQDETQSSKSSRRCSTTFSLSDASGHEGEKVEYADDFDSLASSDACSPDPWSGPEPSRVKTPRSPDTNHSESTSEGRSAPLPVPVRAPGSSHRTLMGTHIIRPRTHYSALSFSSDEDGNGPSSSQTILSRKQMLTRKNQEATDSEDSSVTISGEKSSKPIQSVAEVSSESISSCSGQEEEELQDEVGSLDFRKESLHISKLVASKLPGYTM
ncbi:microtubule-associated protein 10 [Oryzias latipes]|uniref:Microtubule associated protein 10 n=1 Tax=Oryzias latipes TaxID=8090 RepID=H2MBS1_ORYLA|nr:microtubule-associated protein 10 [Oryzias latipes]